MAELTDEQLLKLAATALGYASITPPGGHLPGAYEADASDLLAYGRAAIAAAKAAATPDVGVEELTDGELRSILIEAGLKEARDFTGPEWCALNREQRRSYEEWGCFEDRVMVAMRRAAIAADRAARPQPTAEALQAAFVAWFKAEQHIPPSPAAARTAAAFTLAVLRGEVEL